MSDQPLASFDLAYWKAGTTGGMPNDFRYLNVAPLLPAGDEDDIAWARYVDIVKAKSTYGKHSLDGYNPHARGATRFTPDELLQICLLNTEPFYYDGALAEGQTKIRDVRPGHENQPCDCQNRFELIQEVAHALSDYEYSYRAWDEAAHAIGQDLVQYLKCVESWVLPYLALRKDRKVTQRPRLPRNADTIKEMVPTLIKVITMITPEDFFLLDGHSRRIGRDFLVETLWNIFQRYGLARKRARRYPEEAARYAIAAILLQLGIVQSSAANPDEARKAIAERIRKLLKERSRTP